nr:MAG: hypothetical protein [Bacteriophage sp.]
MKGFIKASVLAVCFCNLALPALVSAKTVKECELLAENKTTHETTREQGFHIIDYPNSFIVEWDSEHRFSSGQLDSRGYNKRPDQMEFVRERHAETGQIIYLVSVGNYHDIFFNCSF